MSYELNGRDVLRDGVKVATVGGDGKAVMEEGCEQYRMPVGNFLRESKGIIGELSRGATGGEWNETEGATEQLNKRGYEERADLQKIETVRQLVTAMQEYIAEPCPAFSPFWGDKTQGVNDWIQDHDDVRKMVLKKHNGA